MFQRQTTGSVSCPSCRQVVAVTAKACPECGRGNPGMWGYTRTVQKLGVDYGFTELVTWGCFALYVVTLLIDWQGLQGSGLFNFLSPSTRSLLIFGATGSIPVFGFGRWWTVLSAAWLHGGLLHIGFNLLWIRDLSTTVATFYGASRLMIIYTVSAMMGGLATSFAGHYLKGFLQGASISIGASGALFGLFGALVSYGQITKNKAVKQTATTYAIICFMFGFLMAGVDNWGHFGGFMGGWLLTRLPAFDPRYKEKNWHFVGAIACLAATVLSVVLSIVTAFPQILPLLRRF